MEMVTDIVVSRQADHELQIGHALQSVVDSAGLEAFYQQNLGQRLQVLEESILQAGEERDRILQRLAFQ